MDRFLRILGVLVLIAVVLLAALVVFHRPVLNAAGRWLIVQDPLARADVIVVLSGGETDERVRQAAALYRDGFAPRVLLSGGGLTGGRPTPEVQREQALASGIPAPALLFETTSTSTGEQAENLRPELERLGVRRALVVTSSYHTRRTRYLFRRAFRGSPVEISVYPVQNDAYDPVEWWTREDDAERAGLEYVKLVLSLFR
jgi:uncharacterized SAM-binding protein YcdF (DUF218 family)